MDDLEEIHIPERDRRSDGPAPGGTPRPASLKYLIVYKDFDTVPKSLQTFVKEKITTEFSPFDVELDFTGNRAAKDLTISFTSEMPVLPIYGESERAEYDSTPLRGEGTIYVRAMQVTRMETAAGSCYDVFPETADKLGALIAYTAI